MVGSGSLPEETGGPEVAIVLVGGFGTRLRPLTYEVPKQLIPCAGQVALYHVFDLVPSSVRQIVLACGYKAAEIESYLEAHPYPLPVRVIREETPLGTGGGMKNASEGVSDPFLLMNGDVVASVDLTRMIAAHREHGGLGTMSLFEVEDTRPYGVVALGAEDRILRFVEKPEPHDAPSHWINAGVSVWSREVLDRVPTGREVSFEREILPGLIDSSDSRGRHGVYGFTFREFWEDAGTPERLLHAQRLLFDHGQRRRIPLSAGTGPSVRPPVSVGVGCRLEGAHVGPYVTLGDRVVLEEGSSVEDSVLMDGVTVGRGATLRNAIVGPGASIPPGAEVRGKVLVREGAPQG